MVVLDAGFFGDRLVEMAGRLQANVVRVPVEWGTVADMDQVRKTVNGLQRVKVIAAVHAETSTGVLQSLRELGKLAQERDALLLADVVTSLCGTPVDMDATGIDFAYSATQKCVGAPPGLSPCALSERALQAINARKTKPYTWYLDIGLLRRYWAGGERVYHHTAPMSMVYALREAMRMVLEEGLQNRFARHKRNGQALRAGLQALGLRPMVPEEHCLYQLTTVGIPQGVTDGTFRTALLRQYNIEIGGGLGQFRGKVWRVGLMGESSTSANVLYLLNAMEKLLPKHGYEVAAGAGVTAASKLLTAEA